MAVRATGLFEARFETSTAPDSELEELLTKAPAKAHTRPLLTPPLAQR
jgi:hypothetical protein